MRKGLRESCIIAQLLEHAQAPGRLNYEPTVPKIQFKDGLPDDELEMANLTSIRTGGKPTLSQKTALMRLDDMTEEQAEAELERIRREEREEMPVDSSIFNESKDVEEETELGHIPEPSYDYDVDELNQRIQTGAPESPK
ncbi:hypothetical protein P7H06_00050 [Paenibacillus larvae]|nr:hypothetical protein [Paenibacillus larvae]MDT2258282.1 hypothetical protein [Paenibacillus larvae]